MDIVLLFLLNYNFLSFFFLLFIIFLRVYSLLSYIIFRLYPFVLDDLLAFTPCKAGVYKITFHLIECTNAYNILGIIMFIMRYIMYNTLYVCVLYTHTRILYIHIIRIIIGRFTNTTCILRSFTSVYIYLCIHIRTHKYVNHAKRKRSTEIKFQNEFMSTIISIYCSLITKGIPFFLESDKRFVVSIIICILHTLHVK